MRKARGRLSQLTFIMKAVSSHTPLSARSASLPFNLFTQMSIYLCDLVISDKRVLRILPTYTWCRPQVTPTESLHFLTGPMTGCESACFRDPSSCVQTVPRGAGLSRAAAAVPSQGPRPHVGREHSLVVLLQPGSAVC